MKVKTVGKAIWRVILVYYGVGTGLVCAFAGAALGAIYSEDRRDITVISVPILTTFVGSLVGTFLCALALSPKWATRLGIAFGVMGGGLGMAKALSSLVFLGGQDWPGGKLLLTISGGWVGAMIGIVVGYVGALLAGHIIQFFGEPRQGRPGIRNMELANRSIAESH